MLHLLLELLEGNHSGTENQAQKKKNISHILSTKTFSQWLLNLRVLCAALLIFFFSFFFFLAVSGRWRRENEVWLEGLCPATVRRKCELRIQLAFYCKCAPSRWA